MLKDILLSDGDRCQNGGAVKANSSPKSRFPTLAPLKEYENKRRRSKNSQGLAKTRKDSHRHTGAHNCPLGRTMTRKDSHGVHSKHARTRKGSVVLAAIRTDSQGAATDSQDHEEPQEKPQRRTRLHTDSQEQPRTHNGSHRTCKDPHGHTMTHWAHTDTRKAIGTNGMRGFQRHDLTTMI